MIPNTNLAVPGVRKEGAHADICMEEMLLLGNLGSWVGIIIRARAIVHHHFLPLPLIERNKN